MRTNTLNDRRKDKKKQDKAVADRDRSYNHGNRAIDRTPATSNGVRQVVSLNNLPTLEKTITLKDGEICLTWRLKVEDIASLKMLLISHEANGWHVEEKDL